MTGLSSSICLEQLLMGVSHFSAHLAHFPVRRDEYEFMRGKQKHTGKVNGKRKLAAKEIPGLVFLKPGSTRV